MAKAKLFRPRTRAAVRSALALDMPLPPPDWVGGPIGVGENNDRVGKYQDVIEGRRGRLSAIRQLPVEALVPERVRMEYAARWRDEHDELQREEQMTLAYRWRAIFRRLVDRIVGPPRLPAPTPPQFPFRG